MGDEMEGILLLSLKQAGVSLADGIDSLRDISVDMLINAAGVCMRLISGDETLPTSLPEEMSGKFTAATKLAEAMAAAGWDGELGFQQFLYPEEKVVRKIISWLVQRLPKTGDEEGDAMQGANVQLFSEITEELGRWKSTPWFPSFSAERGVALTTTPLLSTTASADVAYLDVALPYVTEQARWGGRASLAASLQQQNTLEVAKRRLADGVDGVADDDVGAGGTGGARSEGASSALRAGFLTSGSGVSADQQGFDSLVASLAGAKAGAGTIFSRQTNFTQEEEEVELGGEVAVAKPGETPAEAQRRKKQEEQEEMDRELRELEDKLAQLLAQSAQEQRDMEMSAAQIRQLEENLETATRAAKELEEEYLIKKRTLELLDNPEENTQKLQAVCDKTAGKLLQLATEWETHRKPLIDEYRKKKDVISQRKDSAKVKLAKVKEMRTESKQMVIELRSKEALAKTLAKDLEKLPKDVKRSSYVNRILDIIRNVNKQREEIDKVLEDIREARREINTASDKLQRSFSACDELVFKDAKAKPDYKAVYKILVEMHESFQKLDDTVTENGKSMNEYDRVQAKISDMAARNDQLDMKRIAKDLKAIKAENEELQVKYTAAKAAKKAGK